MIRKRSLTLHGAAVATVATTALALTAYGASGDSAGHDSHTGNSHRRLDARAAGAAQCRRRRLRAGD
jgi:hypothetical protein